MPSCNLARFGGRALKIFGESRNSARPAATALRRTKLEGIVYSCSTSSYPGSTSRYNPMIWRLSHRASRLCCRRYATASSPSSSSTATLTSTATTATTPTSPPLLLKIRKDLKTALLSKDTNRLSVLRALLTQAQNASKTASAGGDGGAITTDLQLLSLLQKSAAASRQARDEFAGAGRQDLADKEESQLRIMGEYVALVETVPEEVVERVVKKVVGEMRAEGGAGEKGLQIGEVMKRVLAPGVLGEKPVVRGDVARVVKRVLGEEA